MSHDHDHDHDHEHGHHHHHHHHHHAPAPLAADGGNDPLPRGAGHGHILYLDVPSGLAGDMIVAALLDLGVPEAVLREALAGLELRGYELHVSRVHRSSIAGRYFDVRVTGDQPARDHATIARMIERASTLTPGARQLALRAFSILAHAEAQVHAVPVEHVHFHEVGAVDSIIDVCAAAIAFDYLGAEVVCSPLPLGRGTIRSAHGLIPLPAPATVLCLRDVPTYDAGIAAELVTPTGACLVAAVAHGFGQWPALRPERVGMGAGTKDWPDRPNLLRAVLGTPAVSAQPGTRSHGLHVVIEANLDDLTPEIAAFTMQRALAAGALDAWTTPIGMKKGRSAITLSVLARTDKLDELSKLVLSETTTLGVRHYPVDRIERPRRMVAVETIYGAIDVKVAGGDGLDEQAAPEYEACKQAAETHAVPIRRVYAAALAAFEARRPKS